jgi:hypothetical protein
MRMAALTIHELSRHCFVLAVDSDYTGACQRQLQPVYGPYSVCVLETPFLHFSCYEIKGGSSNVGVY